MNLRTPLSQAKGLGSAKEGAHHWWMQRLTAIALIPLTLWFVFSITRLVGADFQEMHTWASGPWVATFLVLFFSISYYHAALGMQVVLEDYVSNNATRMVLILFTKFTLALLGVASVIAIIRIAATGQ